MGDFSKIKIPFSLALLAAMFAISPLIQKYGEVNYALFGLPSTSFICSSVYYWVLQSTSMQLG